MLTSKADLPPPPTTTPTTTTPTTNHTQPQPHQTTTQPHQIWTTLTQPYQPILHDITHTLQQQIKTFEPEIAHHAAYHINKPGKRLRPLLIAIAGNAHQHYHKPLITIAVIIEMIHLATLIHDDILDNAQIRRSQPTLATHIGTDAAILLGDCLFAHALRLAASFPTTNVCQAVAQATHQVCSGEILQTLKQTNPPTQNQYLRIIKMKTAELFALSCQLGSQHSHTTTNPQHTQTLRQYGTHLGIAYQIYDDCLDLFGTEQSTGKTLHTDLTKKKHTLPILLLLQHTTQKNQTLHKLNHWTPSHTPWLHTQLQQHQTLQKTQTTIHNTLQQARQTLNQIQPHNTTTNNLHKLTHYLQHKTNQLNPNPTTTT